MERIENDTGLTEMQREWMLTGGGWFPFSQGFDEWKRREFPREWKRNRARLLAEYREKFGLFKRPGAYWELEVTDLRELTEAAYLLAHPDRLTVEERGYLKREKIHPWALNPKSEWYTPEQFVNGPNIRALLEPEELEMVTDYFRQFNNGGITG